MASEWGIPGQGYIKRGHVDSLREGRDAAAQWLRENGMSNFEAEKVTEFANVEHAWWSESRQCFVNKGFDDAEPVTAVHVPVADNSV